MERVLLPFSKGEIERGLLYFFAQLKYCFVFLIPTPDKVKEKIPITLERVLLKFLSLYFSDFTIE